MSGYEDSSGEDFVDGMPGFLEALSKDATEDVSVELDESLFNLRYEFILAMHDRTEDRLHRNVRRPEDIPTFARKREGS